VLANGSGSYYIREDEEMKKIRTFERRRAWFSFLIIKMVSINLMYYYFMN